MKVFPNSTTSFIAAFVIVHAAHAVDATPMSPHVSIQETATLLSGAALPTGLPPQMNTEQWKRYSNQVRSNWNQYVAKIANPMMGWSQKEVPAFQDTVFYPFSGPDFSTVYQMYPNARRYVMAAHAACLPAD